MAPSSPLNIAFPPSTEAVVEYFSEGRLLLLGEPETLHLARDYFPAMTTVQYLSPGSSEHAQNAPLGCLFAEHMAIQLEGFLSHYSITFPTLSDSDLEDRFKRRLHALQEDFYDVVVDLCHTATISRRRPPLGYYHCPDGAALERWKDEINGLVGGFEKPRFFSYEADICAHQRNRLSGCRRCMDSCDAEAIVPAGDGIAVNPQLCQGCAACTVVCPSGALRYDYPDMALQLRQLAAALATLREQGEHSPTVFFYHPDNSSRGHCVEAAVAQLAGAVAYPLQSLSLAGLELMLCSLALGAGRLVFCLAEQEDALLADRFAAEQDILHSLLQALGLPTAVAKRLDPAVVGDWAAEIDALQTMRLAETEAQHFGMAKRDNIFQAADFLARHGKPSASRISLPAGAAYGRVQVDKERCTLCMACVSSCPHAALVAGDSLPQLHFYQQQCLQCAICERACPEQAISLEPEWCFDVEQRKQAQLLHADQPCYCRRCGKAFAGKRLIATIVAALSTHSMYQDESSRQRLEMCDDCRVRDLLAERDQQT